ncbi:MAG TPA: endolytic transglycosylase MltG [Streptosporangiaceae bacterium]|nr:endolytic transglycosylase MltG [Streptosporangiaceae bacterium]
MTRGGGSGDWAERPARRRSGRHSRAPQEFGDPGAYAAPEHSAQAESSSAPAPHARPDPYAAASPYAQEDRYPPAGFHGAPGAYGQADPSLAAGPDGQLRPYGGQQNPGASAGRNGQADPYGRTGPHAVPGPYDQTDPSYGGRGRPRAQPGLPRGGDPLRGSNSLGGAGAPPGSDSRPGRGTGGVRDSLPGRDPLSARDSLPGRGSPAPADPRYGQFPPQGPDQYLPRDGHAPGIPRAPQDRHAPREAGSGAGFYGPPGPYPDGDLGGQDRRRQDRYGEQAGYGEQNGYGRSGSYGPPSASPSPFAGGGAPGYGPHDARAQRGFGGEPDAYGLAAPPGGGDYGPFRWRPPADVGGPEGPPAVPGHGGGTYHAPQPGPGDWEPGRPAGRRPGRDDGGADDHEPGPVGGEAWEDDAGGPAEWDDAPARDGLIPGFEARRDSRRGRGGRPRRRAGRLLAPVIAPIVALVVLVGLGIGGYKIYQKFQSPDYSGPGTGEVTVQVQAGDTAESLGPRLVQAGVVASSSSFISAVKHSSCPTCLQPGFFLLHKHMNSALAYKLLLNPASRIQTAVTIPEGLRLAQILSHLGGAKSPIPASAYAKALKDTAALGLPSYANGNPEGYLFPATYDITPGMNATSVLQAMVTRFKTEAANIDLPHAAAAVHLPPGKVITVASILEAEGGNPKYYSRVAEVIYNRLSQGMNLGLQSTVDYALHSFAIKLTYAQAHVDSPYNTYIHPGLPPGPIDSPGDAAIQAALHPAHGDLLYFVTVDLKTGLTEFTNTEAGFRQLVALCQKNGAGC